MKRILIPILILCLALPVFGTTTRIVSDKLGAFTGPENGTAVDDNVKAALDILIGLIGVGGGYRGTGSIFFVDSGVASSGDGLSWSTAKDTLEKAVQLCTADRGDYILVAAGHAENLAAANAVDIDLAGITVVGLGVGENRPVFSYTNANGNFVIGADDVAIYNLEFLAHVTVVTTAINVETACENFIIQDCRFDVDVEGTDEFVDTITIAATNTDGGLIKNCMFNVGEVSNAHSQSAINFVDCNELSIIGNVFYGDRAVACIESETTAANFILIKDNVLFNGIIGGAAGLNTTPVISLYASTTGLIINNQCFTNVVSPEDAIVAADCFISGNTYSESEAAGGSVPIGKSLEMDALAALGISMTDGASRGRVVYCDSGETLGIEDGLSWATATDTLEEAIQLCSANSGDTIFVAPGHAETATATFVDLDIAGVTVIGLGNGDNRPTFSYDGGTDTLTLGAAGDNCTIRNFRFIATADSIVTAITVEAGCVGWTIEACEFHAETTTVDEFDDVIIITSTADRGTIKDCIFQGDIDGGANAHPQSCINFEGCDYLRIIGNEFYGDRAVACIENAATISNDILIKDNILFNGIIGGNGGLNTVAVISLKADTTGRIIDNACFCDVATPDLAIVADDCFLAGNTYSENESTGGSQLIGINASEDPYFNRGKYFIVEPGAFDTTGAWSTVASHEVVTVTGAVRIRMLIQCTTTVTDGSDDATISLGTAGNTAAWIASTSAGGSGAANQLDALEVWIDATPADLETASYATAILDFVVVGGIDVGFTIGTNPLTGGVLVFHVWWEPLDSTGLCAAGPGTTL